MRQIKHLALKNRNSIKNIIVKTIFFILFLISVLFTMDWLIEDDGVWSPDYQKTDLTNIIDKKVLSEEDYHTILMQTGLGKKAANELLQKKIGDNRLHVFEKYQDNFFSSGIYDCRFIAVIVREERIRDQKGCLVEGFDIPSLKNGDVLITKATHSIGWRHGHAAIVTDASKGETLEAILLGNPTIVQNISKWKTYPSFILLRLKDDTNNDAERIAIYAKKNHP